MGASDIFAAVRFLRETLGEPLVAVIAGVDVSFIRMWADGDGVPALDVTDRLLCAHEITQLLLTVELPSTVRAWFAGRNPELDDKSPALAIASDPEGVMAVARFFVANP